MIDTVILTTYVAVVLGCVFIPGPATLLTVARSSTSGTKTGVATGLGIAVGDIVHTAMAVAGISAIIFASAFMFSLVKYLGAAYMIYLGLQAIVTKAPDPSKVRSVSLTPREAFNQAIIAELLNPKTAIFFLAFLPQFVNPEHGSVMLQLTVLGVIFVVLGLASTIFFAVSAGSVGRFLRRNPIVVRWQGKLVGTTYCGLGVGLALQER